MKTIRTPKEAIALKEANARREYVEHATLTELDNEYVNANICDIYNDSRRIAFGMMRYYHKLTGDNKYIVNASFNDIDNRWYYYGNTDLLDEFTNESVIAMLESPTDEKAPLKAIGKLMRAMSSVHGNNILYVFSQFDETDDDGNTLNSIDNIADLKNIDDGLKALDTFNECIECLSALGFSQLDVKSFVWYVKGVTDETIARRTNRTKEKVMARRKLVKHALVNHLENK